MVQSALARGPVARTVHGQVRGTTTAEGGAAMFRGIPYAAAPAGTRRWLPPGPVEPWDGVRDCAAFGPAAPQNPSVTERLWGARHLETGEDCLSLNVWTPAADGGGRPVLVWIHGGAFVGGAGSTPWYDGQTFCRRGDVVVVTINYRLGALGFLDLSGVDAGRFGRSGNLGLLDQVAALGWVRSNIAAFGGDPDRVTVFGESAGAMSIGALLAMPAASGLFRRAILQSGAAHNVSSRERAASVAERFLAAAGVTGAGADELVGLEVSRLLAAQAEVEREYAGSDLPFQPVVDGADLPVAPLAAVAGGSAPGVALIVGTTADEMRLFAMADPTLATLDDAGLAARWDATLGGRATELVQVYRSARPAASTADVSSAMATDFVFRLPAIRLLEAQAGRGTACYAYLFTMRSTSFGGALGCCHALDVPFTFDVLDRPGVPMFVGQPEGGPELAAAMQEAWIAFARSGDPSHGGMPAWPPYDTGSRLTMELGAERRVLADPASGERRLWDGVR